MHTSLYTAFTATLFVVSPLAVSSQAQVSEERKLEASDASIFGSFGYSSDSQAGRIVVGARGAGSDGQAPGEGAAYIFDLATGQETARLISLDADPGDIFGNTVAINDQLVLVGADREDGNEDGVTFLTDSGSAYLFDAATGQQLFKLRAADALSHAHFGQSVAMSGDLAAIGSNGLDAQGTETGTTYVFDVLTGQQLHKLIASDATDEHRLGESVAMDGELIVSTAVGDDTNGVDAGSAYVFNAVTGAEIVKLLPLDGEGGDTFGSSVAIFGDRVVVGAMRDNDNGEHSGSAYIFDALTGQQLMKLTPDDGATFDNFGDTVAISDSLVIVGAPRDDDNGNSSGSAYVFHLGTGLQLAKINNSDGLENDFFGRGLSLNGDTVVSGTPFRSDNGPSSGSAYVFDVGALVGGVISYCGPGAANSVSPEGAVLLSASGFGTDQATFDLINVPDSFGILFAGNASTNVVLGCGNRCVGGSIIRGPVVAATGNLILGTPFDMSQPGTTHIQYWYRDSGTCGSGFNLSNALTR